MLQLSDQNRRDAGAKVDAFDQARLIGALVDVDGSRNCCSLLSGRLGIEACQSKYSAMPCLGRKEPQGPETALQLLRGLRARVPAMKRLASAFEEGAPGVQRAPALARFEVDMLDRVLQVGQCACAGVGLGV